MDFLLDAVTEPQSKTVLTMSKLNLKKSHYLVQSPVNIRKPNHTNKSNQFQTQHCYQIQTK